MTTTILETSHPDAMLEYTGLLLAEHTSPQQTWKVLQTLDKDEMLFIEGQHQSTKSDEHIYHETFVHGLLSGMHTPKRVLILGGAEGCMIREVLKWWSVQYIKQVDWDASLVRYFQTDGWAWNGGVYSNPKVHVECVEALGWLEKTHETFDAIFIDLLDPFEEDMDFMKKLLLAAKSRLAPNGGVSVNVGEISATRTCAADLADFMRQAFHQPFFSRAAIKAYVPSYKGTWCFLMAAPKMWSSHVQSSMIPHGLKYFSKNTTREDIRFETFYPHEIQNFWKVTLEEYEASKKLTPLTIDWSSTTYEQYGC